ncbi:hypothetical protein FOVG_17616 [Fusarium oxysporum f. sp. pisi HDV247]|uniref:Uncharacterized protein n=1 Tax=Fusarium oxysporum f. sp. pisi HDV247 TaxID=1080344 RepID=W9NE65_FUSOX|nr:hypothetical protein FOVG_17616 [Fusarium oxysporum f. sp. pisi HDV247]
MHVATASLAAAVSQAGGLGIIAALNFPTPAVLREEIRRCRRLTSKPFGVNITMLPSLVPPDYRGYAQAAIDEGVKVVETAGNSPGSIIAQLKDADVTVLHKCTNIRHAQSAAKLGVDFLSVDGFECAGHVGESDITSLVLLNKARQTLGVPFIASGGFADGWGMAAALCLGACGINMGIGFFEYFLPLMTILGDVIQLHQQKHHPRFGNIRRSQDNGQEEADDPATAMIKQVMAQCAQSIADLASAYQVDALDGSAIPASQVRTPQCAISPQQSHGDHPRASNTASHASSHRQHAQAQLVTAYSTFILHVLHVLLHGKWDAVSMLDNKDGWIPSVGFMKCASHAIAASDAMSRILACDPELSFMPYLFGIYLLHGSFILLLFADRMPQLGLNEFVEKACEIIIRAHEVCVVTLSTEFQVSFTLWHRSKWPAS